jgi:glucosylceramidase
MKITQYLTTDHLNFVTRPVYPAVPMQAAILLSEEGKIANEDFRGFGVAITPSSCYNLSLMEAEERRQLLTHIFTPSGLNLSVGRLCIGASDYSAELYSYDDVEGDVELKHFSIDRDRAYVIPMLQEILSIRPDLFLFAAPWSPPAWMKTGNNLCGGFMREEFIGCYADYMIKFLQAYEECGIHVSALTRQNETEMQQHGTMPACLWHPDTEARFSMLLREKLTAAGLDTEIWIFDNNLDNVLRPVWTLQEHKGLAEAINGVGFHYYRGAIEDVVELQRAFPQVRAHFTEGGPRLTDHYDTDWCKWGEIISRTLNNNFGSFTGWNLMLDETGGPNVGPFFCGGLVTRNSNDNSLAYSGQYKAFKHFASLTKDSVITPLTFRRSELPLFA